MPVHVPSPLFGSPSLNTKRALNCLFRSVAGFGRGACSPLSELYLAPWGARKLNFKGKSSARASGGAGSRDAAALLRQHPAGGRLGKGCLGTSWDGRKEGRKEHQCLLARLDTVLSEHWEVWSPEVCLFQCGSAAVPSGRLSPAHSQGCPEALQIPVDSSRGLCARTDSGS